MALTLYGSTPSFSAYYNGTSTAVSAATWTKIQLNAEDFDTNNNFDSTTNYRFTPTIAGYYQINCACSFGLGGSVPVGEFLALYKNGSIHKGVYGYGYNAYQIAQTFSLIVYMNGTTDYLEMYMYVNTSSGAYNGSSQNNLSSGAGASQTWMSGSLIRSVV